jgi:hypothetical protein
MSIENKRYFFDQDESSHWYLIPEEWRDEWEKLNDEEVENAWELDEWQKYEDCRIDGITDYSFENPIEKQ